MTKPPNDRDMEQAVRSWMRDDDEHPADRNRQVGRIMGRVDETHQRRGAWRFLPFGRGKTRVDRDDDDLYVAGAGGVAMRRGMSTAMATMMSSSARVSIVRTAQMRGAPTSTSGALWPTRRRSWTGVR